jgi:hypothetical protein
MNFKKTLLATLTTFMVGGVVLSANQNTSQFEPQAATTETNRIWVTVNNSTWGSAGNTYLYVYGGTAGAVLQSWPGILLITGGNSTSTNYETGNSKWYYDVATQYTKFFFTRRDPANINNEWDRTVDFDTLDNNTAGYNFNLDYDVTNKRTVSNFTASTTTSVSNLSQSIDTSGEACSSASAQTAINTYNGMATFDQNQFDVLDVDSGAGVTTGLQRLQYLKDFYSIATALN